MPGTLLVNKIGAATGTEISFETGHSMAFTTAQFKLTGGTAGQAITTDGSGNLTFADMTSDPTMGGDLSGTASNAQIVAGAVGTTELAATLDLSGKTVTLAADAVATGNIDSDVITSRELAAGAVGATEIAATIDLSSKTVTLPAASVTAHSPVFDDNELKDEIALIGFKVAANGSLAKYNLIDQTIDSFEDSSGIDTSASTGEQFISGYVTGAVDGSKWTAPAGVTEVEVLVVGGGGGGGYGYAGGGGAGGIVHDTDLVVVPGTQYTLTIASGGAAAPMSAPWGIGGAGGDSVFHTYTGKGGGGGGSNDPSPNSGGDGGSGGGAAGYTGMGLGSSTQSTYPGTSVYGNSGGATSGNGPYAGGGGGGANAAGQAGSSSGSGDGGAGKEFASFEAWGTDSSNNAGTPGSGTGKGYFGGGGGGGSNQGYVGGGSAPGGVGGGGRGGHSSTDGQQGIDGTGGGGGAGGVHGGVGSHPSVPGGDGGVFLKYTPSGGSATVVGYITQPGTTFNNMTLVSATTTTSAPPTKGDIVMTYTTAAGTTTVGTDLKVYISRDGSAYTGSITMTDAGTTGGHSILTAHDVDLTGIASGTTIRYKIETLNQSVSKQTRIQAVSLGWS